MKLSQTDRNPQISQVKPGSDEEAFAKQALFKRHPVMPSWPKGRRNRVLCNNFNFCPNTRYAYPDHRFFVAKMNMSSIIVLDFFGGAKTVELKDYFKAKPY